ncbi:MAG: alkaline phosphatase family protein [Proteobacteria bacterium]|nr:hypothetical protein [Desulfobacula sp.]MBU4133330.1 alkaline phosphatase family protein [Pseudomonadota bacterium]
MFTRISILIILALLPCIVLAAEIKSVLIISIDSLHPDALGEETTKTINEIMKKGVFTLNGSSTAPPLTLLSHSAMFSGVGPDKGGLTENNWESGQKQIDVKTIFDDAKRNHFFTGFFYSKEKLGYLISGAVDQCQLDQDFSVENAIEFFKESNAKKFCFLHISGLDRTGPVEGWMSDGYMEELFFIDESIRPLIDLVISRKDYLIIITSDHAGHEKTHGSEHQDDAKLPLVMTSDIAELTQYQEMRYHVTQLKNILINILDFRK